VLAIECPNHGSLVMVPETRIRGLHNAADGILLDIECWCGTRVAIHTGRRASADPGPSYVEPGPSPRFDAPVAPQVS
jgi:hypothetical protein